jgi:hypothetical protein
MPDHFGAQPISDSAFFESGRDRVESSHAYGFNTPITMRGLAWLLTYHARVAAGASMPTAMAEAADAEQDVLQALWERA